MHKQELWDGHHLHYGWKLANTFSHCVCVSPFTPDHAMVCQHDDLTFFRHNEIFDIIVEWLNKVCYDVVIEPPLQWFTGETIAPATANCQDGACTAIHARRFWGWRQGAFFVLEFFTWMHLVIATQASHLFISVMIRRNKSMVIIVGRLRRSLLPPSFCDHRRMVKEVTVFCHCYADLLSCKSNVIYSTTLAWMKFTLSFSLLWSAAVCSRGSLSISYQSIDASPEVGLAESPRDYWFTIDQFCCTPMF